MSVIDDIEALQDRVDELLAEVSPRQEEITEAAVEAVLQLLDEQDLSSLSPAQLDELIREAMRPAAARLTSSTQDLVSARVQTLVQETQAFYASVGVTIPDSLTAAVRKRESAQRVTESLQSGLEIASQKLKQATLEAVEEEIASPGSPSRDAIEDQITDSVDAGTNAAETHARTAINAYDQEYRDELANQSGLSHFLYAGNIQTNSRRFCIAHVGGVYSREQISQMENGQIEPVSTFCGGYNCRHSWVPVDPSWDDDLEENQVPDSTDTISFGQGDRTTTIIPTDPNS